MQMKQSQETCRPDKHEFKPLGGLFFKRVWRFGFFVRMVEATFQAMCCTRCGRSITVLAQDRELAKPTWRDIRKARKKLVENEALNRASQLEALKQAGKKENKKGNDHEIAQQTIDEHEKGKRDQAGGSKVPNPDGTE